jgi:hypothetical protein
MLTEQEGTRFFVGFGKQLLLTEFTERTKFETRTGGAN